MLRYHLRKRGQSTLEYAILIGVIVAGLIAMQIYIKRGYEGKLKESADSMGKQYNPDETTFNYTTTTYSQSTENVSNSNTTTTIANQTTNRTGNETVGGITNDTLF